MFKSILKTYLVFALLLVLSSISSAYTCSLALHDWQLKLFFKIPINAPFIPLSEINVIQNQFREAVTDKILWVIKPGFFTPFLRNLLPLFKNWIGQTKWEIISNGKSVLKIARGFKDEEKKPLIIGSDKNYLKIAVFFDANSNNNCIQIVIAQDSRIRCIFQSSDNPWAQEFNLQSWGSIIFYRLPFIGYIMAFSIYPIDSGKYTFYENTDLVEYLLTKKCLTKRPDLLVDPYAFDFPDLPK